MKIYRNTFFIVIVLTAIAIFTGQLLYSAYNYRVYSQTSADEALIKQTSTQGVSLGEHLMFVAGQSLVSTSLLKQDAPSTASEDIKVALQDFLRLNTLVQGAGVGRLTGNETGLYAYKSQEGIKFLSLNTSESEAYFKKIYQSSPENTTTPIRWNSNTETLTGQTNVVSAVIPMYSSGALVGYGRLDISVDDLQKYASGVELGETGYAFIARDRSDLDKYLKQSSATPEEISALVASPMEILQQKQATILKSDLAGEEQNIAVAPVGATGLKMIFVLPRNEAYAGINTVLIQSGLALLFSLLVFCLIFYVVMQRKVDTPISDLIRTVSELARGDSSAPERYGHHDNEQMTALLDSIVAMPRNILLLVEELRGKNRKVLAQRDEIQTLYEKTSAMNDELVETIRQKEIIYQQLQDSYLDTVHALANSIEASDRYTQGHCQRVMSYSLAIAQAMEVNKDDLKVLEYAALLHDVGKIGIKPEILNKNGRLEPEEFQAMAQHPVIGFNILKGIEFLETCRHIVLQHHERWDGQGYPKALKGEQIHLFSRIITVADSYDAMTTSRPYRKVPFSTEGAINELVANRGKQFDPRIVDAFIEVLKVPH